MATSSRFHFSRCFSGSNRRSTTPGTGDFKRKTSSPKPLSSVSSSRVSANAWRSTSASVAPENISAVYDTSCPASRSRLTKPASIHSSASQRTRRSLSGRPTPRPPDNPPQRPELQGYHLVSASDGRPESLRHSSPAPSFRRISSTGTRVPRITGLPPMISGLTSIRVCAISLVLHRLRE